MRANVSPMPNVDSSAGSETVAGAVCEACSRTIRAGAIRPFRVICAAYAEHDHHDKRAQIAAAEQHQRARAAAVRKHHAVAEQQSAARTSAAPKTKAADKSIFRDRRRRRRREVGPGDRNAKRQRIGPDQPAVAIRPPAAQAAEQAKAAQQTDRAIGETDQQSAHDDNVATAPALAFPCGCPRPSRPASLNKNAISALAITSLRGRQSTTSQARRTKLSQASAQRE